MEINELTENDVVIAVCNYLKNNGYQIEQQLSTIQHGDDIIAFQVANPDNRIYIEAKGATSARQNSYKYGHPFDSAQIRVHVAEAVYKAIQVLSRKPFENGRIAGIALPDNKFHHRLIDSVLPILLILKIKVFWVKGDNSVSLDSIL